MYKIAVIGDKDSVLGFKTIGIDTFVVPDEESIIQETLNNLVSENYAIIYITEKKYQLVSNFIKKQNTNILPAIVSIPSQTENMNLGAIQIKDFTKKAIGMDVLIKNEEE